MVYRLMMAQTVEGAYGFATEALASLVRRYIDDAVLVHSPTTVSDFARNTLPIGFASIELDKVMESEAFNGNMGSHQPEKIVRALRKLVYSPDSSWIFSSRTQSPRVGD